MASASNSGDLPLKRVLEGTVGTEIVIPSLKRLAPCWPLRQHPGLELIRDGFNTWVDLYVRPLKASRFVAHGKIAIIGNLI